MTVLVHGEWGYCSARGRGQHPLRLGSPGDAGVQPSIGECTVSKFEKKCDMAKTKLCLDWSVDDFALKKRNSTEFVLCVK